MDQPISLAPAPAEGAERLTVAPWRKFTGREQWDALAGRASEPNPFAERWCVEAGLAAFDPAGTVGLATFHAEGLLAGVMPLARRWHYERYPLPHIGNWLHANAFCGLPLVAAGHEHAFWRALLGWADAHAGHALFFHLEALPTDGALFEALRDVCLVERRPAAVVHRYERALLASDMSPEAYFEASMSGKKRKELRRQFARLGEQGAVRMVRQAGAEDLDSWGEQFLTLEARGWKGAQGSALACDPARARFFRSALTGAAEAGKLERLAITLDGAPIAMLANFIAPPGAYSFKTAYDERLARFSPGVLLQRENLSLLARDEIAWTDSCAAPDHPMIERIWREKRAVARVTVAIGGALRRAAATAILRAETGANPRGL